LLVLKSFLRHFYFYLIVNLLGLGLFAFIRYSLIELDAGSPEINAQIETFGQIKLIVIVIIVLSITLALISASVDMLVFKPLQLKLPLGLLLLIEIPLQVFVINLVLQFEVEAIKQYFAVSANFSFPWHNIIPKFDCLTVLLLFMLSSGRLLIAVDRKLGHGNIWSIMAGRYYNPKEEERVFMFIDLKDSTLIAEKLGHIKFSQLIKTCFSDLTIVDKYNADVYQFVGDEVVLTWRSHKAFKNNNYLKAFYAFKRVLKKRSKFYLKNFGIEPFFKAGVHAGMVVTTEVGDLKREISYHGDTINTAARLQSMCNNLKTDLIISDTVYKNTINKTKYVFINQGHADIKGKEESVKIFKVAKK